MEENNGNTSLGNTDTSSSENDTGITEEQSGSTENTEDWESRFKGLQKSVQDRSLENKRLLAEKEALAKQLRNITKPQIEVTEEIDDLKYTDPEAWRSEMNKLEQEALKKAEEEKTKLVA